ncbi:unnamed protein product [Rhizophagus irregularis]|nr:unnamed protein product [Rhizophagus irregularis]
MDSFSIVSSSGSYFQDGKKLTFLKCARYKCTHYVYSTLWLGGQQQHHQEEQSSQSLGTNATATSTKEIISLLPKCNESVKNNGTKRNCNFYKKNYKPTPEVQ